MENWVFLVDQCRMQALQFSVHLIGSQSMLLRCNAFVGVQKALVKQTDQQQTTKP